jgi:hypothetical protein
MVNEPPNHGGFSFIKKIAIPGVKRGGFIYGLVFKTFGITGD